jgi:hypothetical protein
LTSIVAASVVLLLWLLAGCASPQEKAQKLFGEGKYQEVVAQYPDTPAAEQARQKLAEKLYNEGKFEDLIKTYGQTPLALKAKAQLDEQAAKKLFDVKDYEAVLKQYPNSSLAGIARDSLAQKLYGDMYSNPEGWEKVQAQYPNINDPNPRATVAKEELERIMHLSKKEKMAALETFVQNPKVQKTLADAKARKELAKMKAGK